MKILALTKYSYAGPSSRYRFYNYQKELVECGVKVEISPFLSDACLEANRSFRKSALILLAYFRRIKMVIKALVQPKKYDFLWVEYELFPYFPALAERLLVWRRIPYVVEYDDAIFHRYDLHDVGIVRLLLRNKIATVVRYSTHVIVCNAYLRQYVEQYSKSISQLPTVVKVRNAMHASEGQGIFVVGWIGSRTTSHYVLDIMPAIRRIWQKYKDIELHLVGFDDALLKGQNKIDGQYIKVIPWDEGEELMRISQFDVGIMPLDDTPWSRGKCGFKLIQYMTCAKPVVASPVGISIEIVDQGVNGYLAEDMEQWDEALEQLYLDKKARQHMGKQGLEKVDKYYSFERNLEHYRKIFERVHRMRECVG